MICPSCQSDVAVKEKDFGALFSCPKCQAGYFINFDGSPEYSDLPMPDFQSLSHEANDQISDHAFSNEALVAESDPLQPVGQEDFSFQNSDFQAAESFSINSDSSPDPLLEPQFGESAFSNVASEISDFGNSETQISSLNYDLTIIGLDTREDLLAFKEQIEDARFAWDVSDLLKQIKNGQLFLPRLNPVQAFILAKRLHFLDVELKWKQNVLE